MWNLDAHLHILDYGQNGTNFGTHTHTFYIKIKFNLNFNKFCKTWSPLRPWYSTRYIYVYECVEEKKTGK